MKVVQQFVDGRLQIHVDLDNDDLQRLKGGAGSGNFNHAGRPGKVGGSGGGGSRRENIREAVSKAKWKKGHGKNSYVSKILGVQVSASLREDKQWIARADFEGEVYTSLGNSRKRAVEDLLEIEMEDVLFLE